MTEARIGAVGGRIGAGGEGAVGGVGWESGTRGQDDGGGEPALGSAMGSFSPEIRSEQGGHKMDPAGARQHDLNHRWSGLDPGDHEHLECVDSRDQSAWRRGLVGGLMGEDD